MLRRVLLLSPLAISLCGCVTTGSESARAEKPPAEKTGTALMHTSLHDERCITIVAGLAQPDASGRYVRIKDVMLKRPHDFQHSFQKVPTKLELPPGDFGFVEFKCVEARQTRTQSAPIAERRGPFSNTGPIYSRPIAAFKVEAGEVVDIGSLVLPKHVPIRRDLPELARPHKFTAAVQPIPKRWLDNLAASDQALFQARVVRPMTVGEMHTAGGPPAR
jgi:hypothetical protein